MNIISQTLYWISTGLLVPVILLLILLFIRSLILIGTFFGQYMQMRRGGLPLTAKYRKLIEDAKDNDALSHKLLSDYEIAADKDLSLPKMLSKMGPILGLMGTLIPMGPALVGLAQGDIASMAYNMQVAFATTVIGLFVSAIGFIAQHVKQRWYLQDLTDLEYLRKCRMRNAECKAGNAECGVMDNEESLTKEVSHEKELA